MFGLISNADAAARSVAGMSGCWVTAWTSAGGSGTPTYARLQRTGRANSSIEESLDYFNIVAKSRKS